MRRDAKRAPKDRHSSFKCRPSENSESRHTNAKTAFVFRFLITEEIFHVYSSSVLRISKLSNLRRCSSQDRGRKTQRSADGYENLSLTILDYKFLSLFLRCVSPWESGVLCDSDCPVI
jgi:hypothetical protein